MLHLTARPSRSVCIWVACSGGSDSMAALSFFCAGGYNVRVAHVNHGTEYGSKASSLVSEYCQCHGIPFDLHTVSGGKPSDKSWEEFWRDERMAFFRSLSGDVITAHTLDDAMETWIWSSLHGSGKLIPIRNRNILRPFLLNTKSSLLNFCSRHHVPYLDDPSNSDTVFTRNLIRHDLMPVALRVNPGLGKVIRKKYICQIKGDVS